METFNCEDVKLEIDKDKIDVIFYKDKLDTLIKIYDFMIQNYSVIGYRIVLM